MSFGQKQNILIAGSSGTIGRALRQELTRHGHRVLTLVRREPRTPDESRWDPATGEGDPRAVDAADAIVDLAGSSIAQLPWTAKSRRSILDSRLQATSLLAHLVEVASDRPDVVVNASAVGFYGDRPGEVLTEASAQGTGFLPRSSPTGRPPRRRSRP